MANNLVLHPKTVAQTVAFVAKPKHALGILGPDGIGKGSVARQIAADVLHIPTNKLDNYNYFRVFEPVGSSISIEQAREIASFMKLKTTGNGVIRRVVIIEHADKLTIEAQNALLKTIEEPPADTVLILTITSIKSVLPTIASRLEKLQLLIPETAATTTQLIKEGRSREDIDKILRMSNGLPGLSRTLLEDSAEHSLVHSIELAKRVLVCDTFERLVMIDEITKNKQTNELVNALAFTAQAALEALAAKGATNNVLKRWSVIVTDVLEAKDMLARNAQPKLVLTNLFLAL